MYRLILTDLDDTLLTRKKEISDYTLGVLSRCRQAGMFFGFSTARSECNARKYINLIRPDAVISCGGALTRFRGAVVHENAFSRRETRALIDAALSLNCEVTADTRTGHYWNYAVDPLIAAPDWGDVIHTDFFGFDEPALKVCIQLPDPSLAPSVAACVPGCDWVRFTGSSWYKFTRTGATKEAAMQALAEHLGIPLSQVIAFGDDLGDTGMLKLAGRGVAVANAVPDVLRIADAVAESCDSDGVAGYLETLLQAN